MFFKFYPISYFSEVITLVFSYLGYYIAIKTADRELITQKM